MITKSTWDFIRNNFPRVPTFYALSKIYKDAVNLPGGPIISGIGAIRENASKLVDEYLRRYVTSLPSYVKDTFHFLQILDNLCIPDYSILVTTDVEALYSSIPHEKGLTTIKHILHQGGNIDPTYNE